MVVDGFRQGYVLPEGAAGEVEVVFAPDAAYRFALGLGLLLVLLLPVARSCRTRDRVVVPAAVGPDPRPHPVVVAAGSVGFVLVVAGPWAAVSAAVAVGRTPPAPHRLRRPRRGRRRRLVTAAGCSSRSTTRPTGPSRGSRR